MPTKFDCPIDLSPLAGFNFFEAILRTPDSPLNTIDTMDNTLPGSRTLTGLTQVVSSNPVHAVPQYKKYMIFTTTATTQLITIPKSFNLSQNGYNSGDKPVLAFGIKYISGAGLATSTAAQRAVEISVKDTDGTPKVYGPTGAATTPTTLVEDMKYVTNWPVPTFADVQNITGLDDVIKVPLVATIDSATKTFNETQIQMHLPAGVTFALYPINIYRSEEDICYLGYTKIIVNDPEEVSLTSEATVQEVRRPLGNIVSQTGGAVSNTFSLLTPTLDFEDYRKVTGAKRYTDQGKSLSKVIEITVPQTGILTSAEINGLDNVSSADDIMMTLLSNNSCNIAMGRTEGVPAQKDRFKFVKGPTGNAVLVSPEIAGGKLRIRIWSNDSSVNRMDMPNRVRLLKGTLRAYASDNSEYDLASNKATWEYRDMQVRATVQTANFNNQEFKLRLDFTQLIRDLNGASTSVYYQGCEYTG